MEEPHENDFYIILPSNACTNFYPSNHASKWETTWENTLNFSESNWKVALTEATFMYPKFTYTTNYGIDYIYHKVPTYHSVHYVEFFRIQKEYLYDETEILLGRFLERELIGEYTDGIRMHEKDPIGRWREDVWKSEFWARGGPTTLPEDAYFMYEGEKYEKVECPEIIAQYYNQYTLRIIMRSKYRFKVTYKPEVMKEFDLDILEYNSVRNWRTGMYEHVTGVFLIASEVKSYFGMTFYLDIEEKGSIFFHKNSLCNNVNVFVDDVEKNFNKLFKEVKINEKTNMIHMEVKSNVSQLTFTDHFHTALGLADSRYTFPKSEIFERYTKEDAGVTNFLSASFPPVLDIGINHLYIYSSICKSINVGGSMVPLLKSIWLDGEKRDYSHGEIINLSVGNPMYIPVASTSINSIEVNIRNEYGKLIPFPVGAVTTLTLHFKKDSIII